MANSSHASTSAVHLHATRHAVGDLLRDWRQRRRLSQMDLALDAGVSTRHLSCVETGRARPSPALLMAVAERLEVPLRERNAMLLAAGYAPRYAERPLQGSDMQPVLDALKRLLKAHQPYPGVVLDRRWNVVLANEAALALTALLPVELCTPHTNIYRASLHPQGLARFTRNLPDWATHLLGNLRRAISATGDTQLLALEAEVMGYPGVREALAQADAPGDPPLLVPCVLDLPMGTLSLFTTLTSFGTPQDVTLQELCVEMFYPADADSEQLLRTLAA